MKNCTFFLYFVGYWITIGAMDFPDDFNGTLGPLVDDLTKGWVGVGGGVYPVAITDQHHQFLRRNGLEVPSTGPRAVEFSRKYPRILVMGKILNIQTHGTLNFEQAAWLEGKLAEGRIKRVLVETGLDGSSVRCDLRKVSASDAVEIIQAYLADAGYSP